MRNVMGGNRRALILLIAAVAVVAAGAAAIIHYGRGGSFVHAMKAIVKLPPRYSETTLCAYKKDGEGGFSPFWAAYIIRPPEGAKDQGVFVEVNGKRLGPYTGVSGLVDVSRDGKHIAYAAEKDGKWVIAVDGVEKYTHKGLLWPWMGWSPTVEGNSYIPQTQAAVLEFSPDGESLAYPAETDDGKYAVFVNGKAGTAYSTVGEEIHFIDGKAMYYAFSPDKKILEIYGTQVLGPYDNSYQTKYSPDGKHYAFWATAGGKSVLVADGQARELPGEASEYAIGNGGYVAYAYKQGGKLRVHAGSDDVPGEWDEVTEMTISPDGKKAAFWGRRGMDWTLWAMGKEYPGFGGYFYYQSGGMKYGVMWSPDSQHIAYYTRDDRTLVLDGVKTGGFAPPGIMLENIVDDQGRDVGAGMMSGPETDPQALVQAVLLRDKTKCEPFAASLFGDQLSCVEKGDKTASMWIGDKHEGPYVGIHSVLLTAPGSKHYAYVVQTEAGAQVVVDGALMPHVYDALYRPVFDDEDGELDLLAVKGGNLVHVVQPLRVDAAQAAKPQ